MSLYLWYIVLIITVNKPFEFHLYFTHNWSISCMSASYVWEKRLDWKIQVFCELYRYLSNGHGAEDVEEDEGTVVVVITNQVSVRQILQ